MSGCTTFPVLVFRVLTRLTMRLVNLALSASLAAVVVGCTAPSQAPAPRNREARAAMLLTETASPRQRCRVVDGDSPLPAVATVIDTAAMREFLHQTGVVSDTGHLLFSLRFDASGRVTRAWIIDASVADSQWTRVQQSVASALLPQPPGPARALRLRIDFKPEPSYRLGKSEYCEAERIVPQGAAGMRTLDRPGEKTLATAVTVVKYEVDVSAAGDVLAVRFASSVDVNLEQAVRAMAMRQRWKPALDDGLPIESTVKTSESLVTKTVIRRG